MTERSWWGWGTTDRELRDDECVAAAAGLPGLPARPRPVPSLPDLPAPRVAVPASLSVSTTPFARASHALGKAYRDVVRALTGDVGAPPDAVGSPRSEADVVALLDWAASAGVAVVPFGGGSSVVGGVEFRGEGPWLSLDLTGLDRVLEIDRVSRAARIQGGALGPVLEDQLRPHGLTLRHFPQSFEFSTLGGWLATRAGGHYATLHTHIDDLVESMRVVTPVGISESWRLPGSGAGPSPDRLFLGSEGTLGVITEAWMRLQDRPRFKASASAAFADMTAAMSAVRAISQAALYPANCRLLDPGEAALSGAATTGECVLVLGVESAFHPVEDRLSELLDLVRDSGGSIAPPSQGSGPADAWRSTFLRMPYVRDGLARMSAVVETFETACTWDRADELYATVRAEVAAAVEEVTGAPGMVNCRFTHVYPDGPAPYFTVIAAGRPGSELAMWDDVKVAAMEVLGRLGATITHHHAVGRDHRPGYDRQRPEPFAAALRAAKAALDPAGVLNPGVLIDPV
ncbi:FAD-binding oxidoreductase [Blastococcus sp. CT_GayMR16]|uniref:FAD-binding oxidoreductase n=1 Tax=Blastococcus sp. CT_GayMR16 TaxID=2559607 RepID=UPI0010745D2B|nr:FAD-binding oxidoreductase [Blastococcus sp. CT_GayMR16]TFV87990.1 FAD-binding oxidoreductase [Blastococcus sp. CT_GayMR16]